MESLDELRDEIKILADNHIDTDELVRITNAIEREVEEKYVESPKDAGGMTITPSDSMVDRNGEQFVVSSIELLASGEWLVYGNGKLGGEFATRCRHHKPPTVEGVLEKALNKAAMLDRREGYWPSAADITNIVNELSPMLQLREEY